MKKVIFSSIATTLVVSASAFAADLPSKKEAAVSPPAPMLWTGFYAGLNAGGTFANNSSVNAMTGNIYQPAENSEYVSAALLSGSGIASSGNAGFIGGGQIGYNWQARYGAYNFVAGIEADIQGVASSGGNGSRWAAANAIDSPTASYSLLSNQRGNSSLPWIGTVRGRLGYLVTPTLLVYGTGGLAYGEVNSTVQGTMLWTGVGDYQGYNYLQSGTGSYSNTQVGWTAGGGVEWMFMQNWSAKAEYLYYDLGKISGTIINNYYGINDATGSNGIQSYTNYSARAGGNIIRAGVNYHFSFASAPVVAKY